MNYASEEKFINYSIGKVNGSINVSATGSKMVYAPIEATHAKDTLSPEFKIEDTKYLKDGEQRKIPILPAGVLDTKGSFSVLDKDSTLGITPWFANQPVQLYAQNSMINVLEEELKSLINYPQQCMEQTANKIWGLMMMRDINKLTNTTFKYEKRINTLEQKLLSNQHYEGGWAWWEKGTPNIDITTKVLQALQHIDSTDAVKQAKRNGYIYLQNSLPYLPKSQLLSALYCLSQDKHIYPYQMALDTLKFDSLTIHQQWQYVGICQNIGLPYKLPLDKLFAKKQESYTGSLYWGEETYYWQRNRQATMVIAAQVVRQDSAYAMYYPRIKQFFITDKRLPYYNNTIEQAEITALLLKDISSAYSKNNASKLKINGQLISNFPYHAAVLASDKITIEKGGSGLMYIGASQQQFLQPTAKKDSLFDVTTTVVYKNITLTAEMTVPAAQTVVMEVNIWVKKDAEFVEIELPIPAGMTYKNRTQNNFIEHRAYLKDKLVIFKEKLPAGHHTFSIALDTKFAGKFTINPAKISMMYFPVFEGYEKMKTVSIMGEQ